MLLLALTVLVGAPQTVAAEPRQVHCPAEADGPTLDHVVLAVRNLDSGSARMAALGFRLKPGRLHRNNLLNRHIKFRDGTELELMSLAGQPGDPMARAYADIIALGDRGAYVALRADDIDRAAMAAARAGLLTRRTRTGAWRFLSFPAESPAAAVFFGTGWSAAPDPDTVLDHPNGARGLAEVWLEGGTELGRLLEALGAVRCGSAEGPDGRQGIRFALRRGYLVVVPMGEGPARVIGVGLTGAGAGWVSGQRDEVVPGFWIVRR